MKSSLFWVVATVGCVGIHGILGFFTSTAQAQAPSTRTTPSRPVPRPTSRPIHRRFVPETPPPLRLGSPPTESPSPRNPHTHPANAPIRVDWQNHPLRHDPLWNKIWQDIHAKQQETRQRAIVWLSQRQEPIATTLLLLLTSHRDELTRWWALAALRPRQDSRIGSVFFSRLQDSSERIRLVVIMGLLERNHWQQLLSRLQDPSPAVREQLCLAWIRHATPQHPVTTQCLQDRAALVRLSTARLILRPVWIAKFSVPEQGMARQVIHAGIVYPFGTKPLRYSPSERLEMAARQLTQYRTALDRLHRSASCLFARKYCRCLEQAQTRLRLHWQTFLDHEERYQALRNTQATAQREQALSFALLSHRQAQAAYLDGTLCRQYQRNYRIRQRYNRLLQDAIFSQQAPIFLPSTGLNYARFSSTFAFDTGLDIFHDNVHTSLPPYTPVKGPNSEAYWLNTVGLSYHFLWNQHILLQISNQFTGALPVIAKLTPFQVDNDFRLSLLIRRIRHDFHLLFFVEERLLYASNLPDEEGFPDVFSGIRLQQYARIGLTLRWGRFSRRSWIRQADWLLHLDYSNHTVWPLFDSANPPIWSRLSLHRSELELSRRIWFVRFGLNNRLLLHHWLDSTPQIPTAQWHLYATISIGEVANPTAIARADAGVGFNAVQSLFLPTHPAIPAQHEAPSYFGEAFYIRLMGFVAQVPLQWHLQYSYLAGSPHRPLFPLYTEHRLQAQVRVGHLRELTSMYPRDLQFDAGLDIRFLSYRPLQSIPPPDDKKDPVYPSVRMGTFYFQLAYPFIAGFRGVFGNRLSLIFNEFRPFGTASESTALVVRNVVYVQLEYWFGGETKP